MSGLSFDELRGEIQVAESELGASRFRNALDRYSTILSRRLEDGTAAFGAADLIVVERLSELSILFGLNQAADDLLNGMVRLARAAGNDLCGDYAALKRAELAIGGGDLPAAISTLREMGPRIGDISDIEITPSGLLAWEARLPWKSLGPVDQALLLSRTYFVLGQFLSSLGQYRDAIVMLDRGLSYAADGVSDLVRQGHLPMRIARACAKLELGNLSEAAEEFAALRPPVQSTMSPAAKVRHAEVIGKLAMLQGRFGDCVTSFQEIAQLCAEHGFDRAEAVASLNLAHVFVLLNRVSEALRLIGHAVEFAKRVGDGRIGMRAATLRAVATGRRNSRASAGSHALSVTEMLRPRQKVEAARQARPMAPPVAEPSSNFLAFFEDRALEFQWALGIGDLDEASSRLGTMSAVFGQTDSLLIKARLLALMGMLAYQEGKFVASIAFFDEALPQLQSMGVKPEIWQAIDLRSASARAVGRTAQADRDVETAQALLAEMANSLDGAQRAIYLLNKATSEEKFISLRIDQLLEADERASQGWTPLRLIHRWKVMRQLDGLMRHIDSYRTGLARHRLQGKPSLSGVPRESSLSLLRRLFSAPRNRAALSFLVLPDRLFLTWSTRLSVGFAATPVSRIAIREAVRKWHESMHRLANGRDLGADGDPDRRPGHESDGLPESLAELLQVDRALEAIPASVRALSIVPDDALHGFPFAAVRHGGRYLVERYALSVAFAEETAAAAREPRPVGGLVVAVTRGYRGAAALPNALPEARTVAAILERYGMKTRLLHDDSADRQTVLNSLSKTAIAHIACHGLFEPDRPDASGLLMIPTPGKAEMITLKDISRLDMRLCAHITLSSCWSADNFVLPGRWIVSLPRALSEAGVRSTLASLWPVDDDVAHAFMEHFYRCAGSMPKDEALRQAQLTCVNQTLRLDRSKPNLAEPFFWAGFNVYGASNQLQSLTAG